MPRTSQPCWTDPELDDEELIDVAPDKEAAE